MSGGNFPRGKLPPAVVSSQTDKGSIKDAKDKLQDLFVNSTKSGKEGTTKTKKRKNAISEEDLKLLVGKKGKVANTTSFEVVPLSYEMLTPGLLSLGVVLDIYNDSMLIELPNRATGKVMATEISYPYTKRLQDDQFKLRKGKQVEVQTLSDIFTKNQILIVKVVSVTKKVNGHHDVQLTTNPKSIHESYTSTMVTTGLTLVGAVKSEEDKGFQIDLGISNVVAFLPTDQVPEKYKPLKIGQLVYCKVISSDSSKGSRCTVRLSLKGESNTSKHTFGAGGTVNYSSILPGMVLNGIVEETHPTGLKVNLGGLEGLVCSDHISPDKDVTVASDWPVTVLYLHPNLTTPYCTLKNKLVPIKSITKGTISLVGSLQKVRIVKVTTRGLIVHTPEDNRRGLISVNHLGDAQCVTKEDMAEKFKPNSMIDCRILKFSYFENMYTCSLNSELLKASVVDVNQVYPGMKLQCKVTAAYKGGMEVNYGHNLRGFVPNSFLGKKKFLRNGIESSTGKSFNGRVMSVNSSKVIITFAQKIIESKGAIISTLDDAKVGQTGHAIVRNLTSAGIVVTTIGGVKGFIRAGVLGEQHSNYQIGDIIYYIVQKVEYDRGQLLVKPYDEKNEKNDTESASQKKSGLKRKHDEKNETLDTESASKKKTGLKKKDDDKNEKNGAESASKKKTGLKKKHDENDEKNDTESTSKKKAGLKKKDDDKNEKNGAESASKKKTGLKKKHDENDEKNDTESTSKKKAGLKKKHDENNEKNDTESASKKKTGLKKKQEEKNENNGTESASKKKAGKKRGHDEEEGTKTTNSSDIENAGEPKKKRRRKNKKKVAKKSKGKVVDTSETTVEKEGQATAGDETCEISQDTAFRTGEQVGLSQTENEELVQVAGAATTFDDLFGSAGEFWSDNKVEAHPPSTNKKAASKLNEEARKTERPQHSTSTDESAAIAGANAMKLIMKYEKQGDMPQGEPEAREAFYWINLILYYTKLGEINKARKAGENALKQGPILENELKGLRIRMALLSLEIQHGTEAACEEVFKNALEKTENKLECYKRAAITYAKQGRFQNAKNIYENLTKKFGDRADAWISYIKFYFENGLKEEARNVFHSAAKSGATLDLNSTLLTSRYAALEIEYGDASRGIQMFDMLLRNEHLRADLWMVYLQALMKNNEIDSARAAFRRAFEHTWKPHKVRSLLSLYKTFEDKHGTDETKMHFREVAIKVLGTGGLNIIQN